MERSSLDQLVLRRKVSKKTNKNATLTRAELEQQTADYLARSGQVQQIPAGISGAPNGLLPPTDLPGQAIAIPRPAKNRSATLRETAAKNKEQHSENGKYVNQTEAAALMGINPSSLITLLKNNMVPLVVCKKVSSIKYFLRTDVEAISPYKKLGNNKGREK